MLECKIGKVIRSGIDVIESVFDVEFLEDGGMLDGEDNKVR